MWMRCIGEFTVTGLVASDCRSGLYPASLGLKKPGEGNQMVEKCLFVGTTNNLGDPTQYNTWENEAGRSLPQNEPGPIGNHALRWDTLNAIEMYDGFIEVRDCRFANYVDLDLDLNSSTKDDYRTGAAFTQVAKHSTWANDPRNRITTDPATLRPLYWNNVARRAYFRDPEEGDNQIAFTLIVDEIDALGHGAQVAVMPQVPYLIAHRSGWTEEDDLGTTGLNGYVVPLAAPSNEAEYAQLTVELDTGNTFPPIFQRTTWARILDPETTHQAGASWLAYSFPTSPSEGGHNAIGFPVAVEVGDAADEITYEMIYSLNPSTLPPKLSVALRYAPEDGRVVFVEIPYLSALGPPAFVTFKDVVGADASADPVSDWAGLRASTEAVAWFHSGSTIVLKLTSLSVTPNQPFPEGTELLVTITD
jgi:hypothetical protein